MHDRYFWKKRNKSSNS